MPTTVRLIPPPPGAVTEPRKLRWWTVLVCALLLFVPLGVARGADSASEYQVKAAFIYNFMKFVDWPGEGGTTLTLGVLGRDPFGEALDQVKGKTAKGRRIQVVRYKRVEEAKDADILFISDSEKPRLSHILRGLQGSRVLTVADQEGFCEAGGMINLIAVKNRIVFEINTAAANKARLRISSQLLKLARSVIE